MSDFDKEAEREKLREKYERDRKKRQSTQVMSDLLLKGATMTNRHCDNCGDPIFRYDGQEFCPTCQRSDGDESGSETAPEVEGDATAAAADRRPTASEGTDAEAAGRQGPVREEPGQRSAPDRESRSPGGASSPGGDDYPVEAADSPSGEEGLSEAHDSLVRTVVKFSRAAESTDDPRRAREALSAAREAAETLDALRR